MLCLALKECKRMGINKVHICPNSTENKAAIQTILNNGGCLLNEFIENDMKFERYEISIL